MCCGYRLGLRDKTAVPALLIPCVPGSIVYRRHKSAEDLIVLGCGRQKGSRPGLMTGFFQ